MHDCCAPAEPTKEYEKKVEEIKQKDQLRDCYTIQSGYEVVKIKECEWKQVNLL